MASLPERAMRRAEWRRLLLYGELDELAAQLERIVALCLAADERARLTQLGFLDLLLDASETEELALEALDLAGERGGFRSVGLLLTRAPPVREIDAQTREARRLSGLPLGVRKWHSALPDRHRFEALLADPNPEVVSRLAANPRIREGDIVAICARRPNFPDVLETVARSRWLESRPVRETLIQNPYVSPGLAIGLLPQMGARFLAIVRHSSQVHRRVAEAARYWLRRSPGWRDG
jgi:hypothetical protein